MFFFVFIISQFMGIHFNCIDNLMQFVDAIGTHNICLYKEVDKQCTGCNLKNTDYLLDCALTGVQCMCVNQVEYAILRC